MNKSAQKIGVRGYPFCYLVENLTILHTVFLFHRYVPFPVPILDLILIYIHFSSLSPDSSADGTFHSVNPVNLQIKFAYIIINLMHLVWL